MHACTCVCVHGVAWQVTDHALSRDRAQSWATFTATHGATVLHPDYWAQFYTEALLFGAPATTEMALPDKQPLPTLAMHVVAVACAPLTHTNP